MGRPTLLFGALTFGLTAIFILATIIVAGRSTSDTVPKITTTLSISESTATASAKPEVEVDHTADPGVLNIEDIPIYEGAQLTDKVCGEPSDKCTIELRTDAAVEEVGAFYRKLFTGADWTLLDELVTTHGVELYYVKVIDTATPPLRYYVSVRALQIDEPFTTVSLHFERWPDARELPIYPEAQQVTVEWYTLDSVLNERITRFVTKASPSEVEAYYKDVMSQQGWTYRDYEPPHSLAPDRPGIYFRYSRTSRTVRLIGGAVTLFTDAKEGGLTQVELRAEGTDIEELWEQQSSSQ